MQDSFARARFWPDQSDQTLDQEHVRRKGISCIQSTLSSRALGLAAARASKGILHTRVYRIQEKGNKGNRDIVNLLCSEFKQKQ